MPISVLKLCLTVIAWALFVAILPAQQGLPPAAGARGRALGGAGLTFQDAYAAWSNPAGLARLENTGIILSGEQRYGLSELQEVGLAAAIPLGGGGLGLTASSFGFEAYRDTRFALSYGRKLFDNFRIGGEVIGLNTSVENYDSRFNATFSLGFQIDIDRKLSVGTRVISPLRVEVATEETLPQLLGVGIGYRPNEQLLLLAEMEQEIDFLARFRFGLEYALIESFTFRAGVVTEATEISFGAEYQAAQLFRIGLVAAYHETLGWSPGVEIVFVPGEKE
ncbi:MAG: hypothetical protein AAGF87_19075 [Bacteroidota bacterium]